MANLKKSKKRVKQDKKKFLRNKSNLSRIKTFIKKFLAIIKFQNKETILTNYPLLVSEIDKGVRKGVYHRNKASRLKSLFSKKIKNILGM